MKNKITNRVESYAALRSVADTVSGTKAAQEPAAAISHYEALAERLWLPPELEKFANSRLELIAQGRTAWGSIAGPYGFGKTAAGICLWQHGRSSGFLAIPPLSCTNFDELAAATGALAEAQLPALKSGLRRLRADLWREEFDEMVRSDADRYGLPQATLRRLFRDKAQAGRLAFNSDSHRFVEFLSRLGELAARHCKGLVVIVDEIQQLLGPLDARTVNRFREFVWGMRTERSRCGVILALDALLEARLARWAEDILHRIRETGPTLQLSEVYTRDFPRWLWRKLSSLNGSGTPRVDPRAVSEDVLVALGQLVERSDLANGPRTVIDVFGRALEHFAASQSAYGIIHLIDDVHEGRFRYFGEGYPIQTALGRLLADEWISNNEARRSMVKTLAAFPLGCPDHVLRSSVADPFALDKTVDELFAPLLVKLSAGLALEALQQVRRPVTNWERIIQQCWERLPALDALAAHSQQFILRILVPRLFPRGNPSNPQWELVSDEASVALTGWRRYRGSFDTAFPSRQVALYVGENEPSHWPEDADVAFAMTCDSGTSPTARPSAVVVEPGRILLRMPVLRALQDGLPAELCRYRKFIQPEPFRPAMVLAALHDLHSFAEPKRGINSGAAAAENASEPRQLEAFVAAASDFLLRELLEGLIDIGLGHSLTLRGPELIQALFVQACRRIFPDYLTLARTPKWREMLKLYHNGLRSPQLSLAQRQGREEICGSKAELYQKLFQQKSTAAGDSLIRALGPLANGSGDSHAFVLRLALHPAEVAVLQYLRQAPRSHAVPARAAAEFLRHRGYIEDEATEVIEILAAREAIAVDRHGIKLLKDDVASRAWLLQRISTFRGELLTLGIEPQVGSTADGTSADLRQTVASLEEQLKERVEELSQEVVEAEDELTALVGEIVASGVSKDWLTSDLSTQLRGVGLLLERHRNDLLSGLRKELKRVQAEVQRTSCRTTQAAAVWYGRREAFHNGWEKLRLRTQQLRERIHAISQWLAPNSQLHATRALCGKVRTTDSGTTQMLDQLVADFRERFAVDQWAPVFASGEFAERLRGVQADVQILLFRHVQNFYHERDVLLRDFVHLLPRDAPPFRGDTFDAVDLSFQELYRWACDHFRAALEKCRQRHASKVPWRDPRSARLSFREINTKANTIVAEMTHVADYKKVLAAGAIVDRIRTGFRPPKPRPSSYEYPEQPPDFSEIAELFANGSITIRIEPRGKQDGRR